MALHIERRRVKTQTVNRLIVIIRDRNYFNEHVAQTGDRRDEYWDLVRRPDGRRPLARPGHIKMDLQEAG
jgi:hypothetical protein